MKRYFPVYEAFSAVKADSQNEMDLECDSRSDFKSILKVEMFWSSDLLDKHRETSHVRKNNSEFKQM